MSSGAKLFVGILVAILIFWLIGQIFAATIGYVVLAAIAFTIASLVVALVRASLRAKADPKTALVDRADKVAQKKLEQTERKINAERLRH